MHAVFLFIRIFQLLLWYIINFVFKAVQCLIWELNGVAAARRQANMKPDSNASAQVLKIRGKFKFCDYVMAATKWDFILTHERFETPEYVLQDHITLYAVTEKEAVFVEASPGVKVWDTDHHPSFFMPAQYYAALKVILMPIESLHYLADKVGDPKGKLVFLSNCARCGSTLMARLFEATERFVTFGEPNCLNFLGKLDEVQDKTKRNSSEPSKGLDRLAVSTVRLLCKQTRIKEIGYLVKICSPIMTATPLLMRLFPNSRHMYLYRNPLPVSQSIYRLSCTLYSLKLMYFFGINSATRLAACFSAVGLTSNLYRVKVKYDLCLGTLNWCVMLKQYEDFLKSGLEIVAIRYEDIVENPVKAMTVILKYCELPTDLAVLASEGMKRDSQQGTPISKDVLQKFPLLPCEGGAKVEYEEMLKEHGFLSKDKPYIADFTITYQGKGST